MRKAESDDEAFDEANKQSCDDNAPERAKPADHHHNEGRRNDFLAHSGMHRINRREQDAGEAGEADAKACNRRHVGLQ